MTDQPFEATVISTSAGPAVVLSGTVNKSAKEALEASYSTAETTPGELVLDFSGVTYINSTGIALIVGLLARARAADRQVGARGLTEHYREVFEITRLSDFMRIYDATGTGT